MSLSEFLLARIAEREAAANAARFVAGDDLTDHDEPEWWVKEEHGRVYAGHWYRVVDGGAPTGDRTFANTAALPHIALHDPAHELARCEADRRIVEFHKSWPVLVDRQPTFEAIDSADPSQFAFRASRQIAWLTEQEYRAKFGDEPPTAPMLRALAAVYADHPDYQEEWKP